MAGIVPQIVKVLLSRETQESASLVLRAIKTSRKREWRSDLVVLEEKFKHNQQSECFLLISFALKLLASKGWDERQTETARFTSVELVRNSFVHGFRRTRRGKVYIRLLISSDLFEITVKTPGHGFDLRKELERQRADDPRSRPEHALAMIYRIVTALTQDDKDNLVRAVLARHHKPPKREELDNLLVLKLEGDLDNLALSGYDTLEAEFQIEESHSAGSAILVDLSEVTSIGSGGVGLIMRVFGAARKRQRVVAFWCNAYVLDFVQITRLAQVIPAFKTRDEAIAYLRVEQEAKTKEGSD
jgi:anti-anti-sigma factor